MEKNQCNRDKAKGVKDQTNVLQHRVEISPLGDKYWIKMKGVGCEYREPTKCSTKAKHDPKYIFDNMNFDVADEMR
ncbi:hypothetical protein QW180_04305 [Vibrio sinaloensis]|nr:hypothetical protein [Vibrio sinaloensis]